MLRLMIFLVVSGASILGSQAACNTCSVDLNIACISDTEFQFCDASGPIGQINSCPTGTYCTNQLSICQSNASLSACGDCGKCNDDKTFACTGPRTFALCMGSDTPSNNTGICAPDHVCNASFPGICGNETETSATCPWNRETTTPAPTTDSTPIPINDFCRTATNLHGPSYHAIPNDTECTSYIYCKFCLFSWETRILRCPRLKPYFNGRTRSCGRIQPTQPGCL